MTSSLILDYQCAYKLYSSINSSGHAQYITLLPHHSDDYLNVKESPYHLQAGGG